MCSHVPTNLAPSHLSAAPDRTSHRLHAVKNYNLSSCPPNTQHFDMQGGTLWGRNTHTGKYKNTNSTQWCYCFLQANKQDVGEWQIKWKKGRSGHFYFCSVSLWSIFLKSVHGLYIGTRQLVNHYTLTYFAWFNYMMVIFLPKFRTTEQPQPDE